jgi:D-serine deaminase-like pyridoxal phosphate-dependent protein
VALRPHIKTHKSIEIAHMQRVAGAVGITAAKLSEAQVFIDAGFDDVFVAYPIVTADKCAHAAQLAQRARLVVAADSLFGLQQLSAAAQSLGSSIGIRLEVDTGLHRCGLPPAELLGMAQHCIGLPGLFFDGIFTYRGAWFAGSNGRSPTELGIEEGRIMVELAAQLRAAGIAVPAVSVGSTPTGWSAATVPGVTEIRPGTYVFGDDMQLYMANSCTPSQVALAIHCTVVSRPDATLATVDGGSKTFSGDMNPEKAGLRGYATALDCDAVLLRMNEEHGVLHLASDVDLRIGQRIALRPNHVCTTVNLSDVLYLYDATTDHYQPIHVAARGRRH